MISTAMRLSYPRIAQVWNPKDLIIASHCTDTILSGHGGLFLVIPVSQVLILLQRLLSDREDLPTTNLRYNVCSETIRDA